MVGLYKDPEGKHVFTMSGHQTSETREEASTTETLRRRIRELEGELKKKVDPQSGNLIKHTLHLSLTLLYLPDIPGVTRFVVTSSY